MQPANSSITSAVALVNAFLHRALQDRVADLTVAKAHDLVYLCHGWHLASEGRRLVADGIHCDADGVFSPSVRAAGGRGTRRVDRLLTVMLPDARTGLLSDQTPLIPSKSPLQGLLDVVWSQWGQMPAYDLRCFTRDHGSPWDLVWNEPERSGDAPRRIPNSTIHCWFNHYVRGGVSAAPTSLDSIDALEDFSLDSELGELRPV